MIGLIIPPGEIKKLIETTAAWVAENGAHFEQYIIEKSKNDIKFAFLNTTHPYRGYFDQKVEQYRTKLIQGQAESKQEPQVQELVKKEEVVPQMQEEQKTFIERVFKEVKVPDPDQYFVQIPQKLSLLDIDIIQHTAQYVAKNGKKFLEALGQREKSNPQFEFLKSTSQNFKFFTKLIDGYSKVLSVKPGDIQKISILQTGKDHILNICLEKFEYEQSQQQLAKGKKVDTNAEEDNIDWHDFQLVETIEFQDDYVQPSKGGISIDDLTELMRRKLGQQTAGYQRPVVQIISGPAKSKEIMQACASCGKYIPASEINIHLKTCMLDPKEKMRRQEAQNKRVASGNQVDISQNINILASQRQEVFGPTDMSFQLPVQSNRNSTIWDGQNPNMSRTTASIAMIENQKRKLAESLKNQKK